MPCCVLPLSQKKLMTSAVFQRETLPLEEILKNNLVIRIKQMVFLLAKDVCNGYQNDDINEF